VRGVVNSGSGDVNSGGDFIATSSGATTNYGIHAIAANGGLNYAGYFDGDVYVNGGANSGTGYLTASDQQFKNQINDIQNAMDIIGQINPKTYYLDTLNSYKIKFSNKLQYGMIAQDVELVLPELVGETTKPAEYDSLGNEITTSVTYKNLNYNAFIPILTQGIKEQQLLIDSLKSNLAQKDAVIETMQNQIEKINETIDELSALIGNCCSNSSMQQQNALPQQEDYKTINTSNIFLKDMQSIVLDQNVPNPFAEQTVISYFLPDDVKKAQMLFYNNIGKLINSFDLEQRGHGEINVFAGDLSSGIYTYTLVVDGKIFETKRMVKK